MLNRYANELLGLSAQGKASGGLGGGGQRLIYVDSVRRGHWSPVNSGA